MTSAAPGTLDRLRGADFLDIAQLESEQLRGILDLAGEMKAGRWSGTPLAGRHVALIFQKPSMRTRVSFQVGIERLGGRPVALTDQDIGLGQRESVHDVARVLDRYVDGLVARLFAHQDLMDLAAASSRPVVNALTDGSHPCQVLADLMTLRETLGRLDSTTHVAFVGDGNNVARSLVEAAGLLGFPLTVVTPPSYEPSVAAPPCVSVTSDLSAIAGAAAVYTDVWTSMGQEAERAARVSAFAGYTVTASLLAKAADHAIFLHCLPAHRGEEVSAEVIDGPQSRVWPQAANRMHAMRGLLLWLFEGTL